MADDEHVFSNAEAAIDHVTARLIGENRDLASRVAHLFVDGCREQPSTPGYRMRVARWVIKNEDLDLINTLSPAAITCATAAADTDSVAAITAAAATSLSAVALLVRQIRSYTMKLTPQQELVLIALKATGPGATADALAEHLELTPEEIAMALDQLSALRTPSGEQRAVVERARNGGWFVLDV